MFVGAFIGSPSMNLYEGTLNISGGSPTVTLGSQTIGLSAEALQKRPALNNYDGQNVIIGIRPEDFEDASLSPDIPESDRMKSTVGLIEALGSDLPYEELFEVVRD